MSGDKGRIRESIREREREREREGERGMGGRERHREIDARSGDKKECNCQPFQTIQLLKDYLCKSD